MWNRPWWRRLLRRLRRLSLSPQRQPSPQPQPPAGSKNKPKPRKPSRSRRSQHRLPSPRSLRRLQGLQRLPPLPLSPPGAITACEDDPRPGEGPPVHAAAGQLHGAPCPKHARTVKNDDAPRAAQRAGDAAAVPQDVPVLQHQSPPPKAPPAARGGARFFPFHTHCTRVQLANVGAGVARPLCWWQSDCLEITVYAQEPSEANDKAKPQPKPQQ